MVKDGQPVGGVQELTFTEGDDIRFRVESDVSDEVHFHGYDVGEDVEAGGSVEFDVPATITGVFEVELEERVVPAGRDHRRAELSPADVARAARGRRARSRRPPGSPDPRLAVRLGGGRWCS